MGITETKFPDFSSSPKIINNGTIPNMNGEKIPYTLEMGLVKNSILECNAWKDFTTEYIIKFENNNPDIVDYRSAMQGDLCLKITIGIG
jgi:hypothetical protein